MSTTYSTCMSKMGYDPTNAQGESQSPKGSNVRQLFPHAMAGRSGASFAPKASGSEQEGRHGGPQEEMAPLTTSLWNPPTPR